MSLMNKPVEHGVTRATDSIQKCLTNYACSLDYSRLSPQAIHAAKVRIMDTFGALMGGFFDESSRIARKSAARNPNPQGSTVIGTRMKTSPDIAAFVNATASRCVELNDTYHGPMSHGGHPSDVIMPVLAAAEHAGCSGRELITGVVLAYEVYLRISDTLPQRTGFDCTTFAGIAIATAAGKMLGLSPTQLAHCISIGVVPTNALNQGRSDHLSMWKAVAAGAAGRNGVFAALLARDGMEGPHLPFEGKHGWCKYVAGQPVVLEAMGGTGTTFKIEETLLKKRACCATSVSNILAAEKVSAAVRNRIGDIKQVLVDTYELSHRVCGTGEIHWNPDSRETADHSIPYGVAAALIDGTVTPRSFDDAHLWDPELRALMQKVEVSVDADFTRDYEQHPVWHRSRVTVVTHGGERIVGETGADETDLSTPMSEEQIERKFRGLSEDYLGKRNVDAIVESLWKLEDMENVEAIPPAFVMA